MKMYLLVGNVASGKSTWSKQKLDYEKQKCIHEGNENWPAYINQDVLGSRQKCLNTAEECLKTNHDVIIDRTNMSKKQRNYWISLAQKYNTEVHLIEFFSKPEKCLERALNRTDHPTIKNMSESKIKDIIKKFYNEYEKPEASEGYISHTSIYTDFIIQGEL